MDFKTNPEIALLDEIKIQAQVILPVLKALRAGLGKERADGLVLEALRASTRQELQELAAQIPGSPKEKYTAIDAMFSPQIREGDLEIETFREDAEAQEFNVTRCRYAEFFRQLGEPELGAVLLCEQDFNLVEIGSPAVALRRTQTIMQGACCCDFRYRLKSSSIPE